MTVPRPLQVEIISQVARLDIAVLAMAGLPVITLDTESNSFHHYPEQLCLIQIATRQQIYVIDTIALNEIAPLKSIVEDVSIEKVIHGADYDIRCLDRHYGYRIRNLYDTSIAARFAGCTQFGLAALLKDVLGVTIPKSTRLQRTDWGRRPLAADALDYAITDVSYLLALREALSQRLESLGRTAWVAEECARLEEVRYTEPDLETAYLSIKGARNLDGSKLAVLQKLFLFREKEARRQRRPPFYVLSDATLIYLAGNPTASLSEVPGLGQTGLERFGRELRQALRDGLAAPPVHNPPPVTVELLSQAQMRRFQHLKDWRKALAATLTLDPSLVWPMASLERLARTPGNFEFELTSPQIRRWQREQFASSLRSCLESLG